MVLVGAFRFGFSLELDGLRPRNGLQSPCGRLLGLDSVLGWLRGSFLVSGRYWVAAASVGLGCGLVLASGGLVLGVGFSLGWVWPWSGLLVGILLGLLRLLVGFSLGIGFSLWVGLAFGLGWPWVFIGLGNFGLGSALVGLDLPWLAFSVGSHQSWIGFDFWVGFGF